MKDGLSIDSLTRGLGTSVIGQKVLYYPRVSSTIDLARTEAQQRAVAGTVVVTEEQTQGRGRRKRAWLSPKGSLALSVVLYPDLSQLPSLIMLASLAVVRSIGVVTGLAAQIKWPNDVLVKGKKVCGVLIENEVRGSSVVYSIISIGINVNLGISGYPAIAAQATSLSDELGREVSLSSLTRKLLRELDALYATLLAGGALYEEWRSNLATLGKEVCIESKMTRTEGVAESVDRDGSLLIRHPDGTRSRVVAGDVSLRERK
jgi:BirA family biotin operon repressor/biotin-[acetyl-CoA-carboxylase] ligase